MWETGVGSRELNGLALNLCNSRPGKVIIFIIFLLGVVESEKSTRELRHFSLSLSKLRW